MYYVSNIVVTRCMEECVAWLGLKVEKGKDVVEKALKSLPNLSMRIPRKAAVICQLRQGWSCLARDMALL